MSVAHKLIFFSDAIFLGGAEEYLKVLVPEMNLGQLAMLLRAEFLVDVRSHTSVRGLPFSTVELADVISTTLEELS
jgi:2-oxoglutarate ferredoxin oxidoreductase subunit alpha